jgi:hypothetical protein
MSKSLSRATINLVVIVEGYSNQLVEFQLLGPARKLVHKDIVANRDGIARSSISLENPQLWYAPGYGAQPPYAVNAHVSLGSQQTCTLSKRTSVRRVELIQRCIKDQSGSSFLPR